MVGMPLKNMKKTNLINTLRAGLMFADSEMTPAVKEIKLIREKEKEREAQSNAAAEES
jgi:hypothetical protein